MIGWIATILTVLGLWLNGRKLMACWPVSIAANVTWIVAEFGNWPIVYVNLVLLVFGLIGWRTWRKDAQG